MPIIKPNPSQLFPPYLCYSHAIEIRGDSRLLKYGEANMGMRGKFLGGLKPSSTVICCHWLDPNWKLESEAAAAAQARSQHRRIQPREALPVRLG